MTVTRFMPPTDHLVARAISAYLRDGGNTTPSIQESNLLEYAGKTFVEVRCPEGSLLRIYKFIPSSGRLQKQ